ncbi:bifunctional diaminohydroxyphosphoribosylaminopyrimidine deaminase/5-amino-6-(5-phosphoribosylamino)uracil reductase RibD [Thermoactinomyces sp. DSM 45892]|uniref:bifunctional diaminohydroxyphosphoribosylaminopyrimidine deaminase/5-amino-6-(5-phosphoribosylamino)uracil reductase RibD n=1 Tax=Thermoactinomyces sp. DSM 45892 TaxID=1882753 RepID=UPI00089CFADD|nr:bifunctional diaminohydroxyphosphoribosylaminopyrimidine deaminase/5-amino-6-(5-phosphoribosylamino)uracil reductase RibD [Thermoactinomyces sp. DSM 45892]SDZ09444.1 diaminohydroxyphosphoribosylaminopyrimidine deaminase / 5-amino-6-(5-phosphoribosylamino)uracil reductase [Thermoactinomyces sp. DSM 45892]
MIVKHLKKLKEEADSYYKQTGLPFIVMKSAMTLDGKIATSTGDSKWVTGEASRNHVHELRNIYDGIMIGVDTAIKDRPQLTTRLPDRNRRNPVRIITDSQLRLPLDSPLVDTSEAQTWVLCTDVADIEKEKQLVKYGVKVLRTGNGSRVALRRAMEKLGENGIQSVLLEGGGQLNWSMLEASLVQKAMIFIAPKLLGGKDSISPISGEGFAQMGLAVRLDRLTFDHFGEDICISGYPIYDI